MDRASTRYSASDPVQSQWSANVIEYNVVGIMEPEATEVSLLQIYEEWRLNIPIHLRVNVHCQWKVLKGSWSVGKLGMNKTNVQVSRNGLHRTQYKKLMNNVFFWILNGKELYFYDGMHSGMIALLVRTHSERMVRMPTKKVFVFKLPSSKIIQVK